MTKALPTAIPLHLLCFLLIQKIFTVLGGYGTLIQIRAWMMLNTKCQPGENPLSMPVREVPKLDELR